jgi:hypothetical protein
MTKLAEKMRFFAHSKAASLLLLFSFFYMVAAASHAGFMVKWALQDEQGYLSFESMIDGSANKPYVYRQLLPTIAKAMQPVVAESKSFIFVKLRKFLAYNADPQASFSKAVSANIPGYEYTYRIICLANFLALLCSLFILRSLALNYGYTQIEASLAPSAFILAFPYIQTVGGYFYDSIELAFLCGAIILAVNNRVVLLVFLVVFATFNKESFFFIIPTLYPFLREKFSQKRTIVSLIVLVIVAGLVNTYVKFIFQDNSGGFVVFQFWENLRTYLTPSSYFRYETTYGLPSPSRTNIMTLLLVFIIIVRGWRDTPTVWKRHLQIAVLINLPLFIIFCAVGELRNLSLTFAGFVVLIATVIQNKSNKIS